MLKAYVGTKIIKAEPAEKDGKAGYRVMYPDGYVSWSPRATFEAAYREISKDERELLEQTNAEAAVSQITDSGCRHMWTYRPDMDDHTCGFCGEIRQDV